MKSFCFYYTLFAFFCKCSYFREIIYFFSKNGSGKEENVSSHHCYYLASHPYLGFIGKLDVEPLTAGLTTRVTHWRHHVQFTGDPYWRIYLPLKGEFRLQYLYEEVAVAPGALYLVPANVPFRVRSITPSVHYWLHFFSDSLERIQGLGMPFTLPADPEIFRPRFREIIRAFRSAQTCTDFFSLRNRIASLLEILLEHFIRDHGLQLDGGQFSRILEYVDRNLERPLVISELRAMTSLSGPEFSAQFRKATGFPPKQYISIRRISKAKMLLLRTRDSIKEVAMHTGFENEFFFFRIFKKYTGFTPTQYREKNLPVPAREKNLADALAGIP